MQRVLIIHQNFPGQFRHVAQHLAARKDVELVCFGSQHAPGLPGVLLRRYRTHRSPMAETHPYLKQMEHAVLRGQAMARELRQLARSGFKPDVILAHPGWGETLYAKDIFPDTRLVHFCEWYYGSDGADVDFDPEFPTTIDARLRARTWNALHTLNLEMCDVGITPTQWQLSRHPKAYWPRMKVIHEGIDTDYFRPDPQATFTLPDGQVLKAGDPIVTYVARNLEPYRGFHIFMRALERIQRQHETCRAIIVGGDKTSYGPPPKDAPGWRERMLREVKVDPTRTHFTGWIDREAYRRVLQVSAVHVYLTYPFVLSWSMLEAMACGCSLVASDTAPVKEFIAGEAFGRLVRFGDTETLAGRVVGELEAARPAPKAAAAAPSIARARSSRSAGLAGYLDVMSVRPTQATTTETAVEQLQ